VSRSHPALGSPWSAVTVHPFDLANPRSRGQGRLFDALKEGMGE
jgi:hypothetical protein